MPIAGFQNSGDRASARSPSRHPDDWDCLTRIDGPGVLGVGTPERVRARSDGQCAGSDESERFIQIYPGEKKRTVRISAAGPRLLRAAYPPPCSTPRRARRPSQPVQHPLSRQRATLGGQFLGDEHAHRVRKRPAHPARHAGPTCTAHPRNPPTSPKLSPQRGSAPTEPDPTPVATTPHTAAGSPTIHHCRRSSCATHRQAHHLVRRDLPRRLHVAGDQQLSLRGAEGSNRLLKLPRVHLRRSAHHRRRLDT